MYFVVREGTIRFPLLIGCSLANNSTVHVIGLTSLLNNDLTVNDRLDSLDSILDIVDALTDSSGNVVEGVVVAEQVSSDAVNAFSFTRQYIDNSREDTMASISVLYTRTDVLEV